MNWTPGLRAACGACAPARPRREMRLEDARQRVRRNTVTIVSHDDRQTIISAPQQRRMFAIHGKCKVTTAFSVTLGKVGPNQQS